MIAYRLFILLYPKIVWLLRFTNPKARLWVTGRRGIFKKLAAAFYKNSKPVVWMHCASLGEFEQGRPVLEALRREYPSHCLLLTFFSPSGYEIRKNYDGVDHVFYLPMDSPSNASRFLNIVQPSLVLFVKYEFWFYYLSEAKQRNIPLLLVSGIFRKDQLFFRWYGGAHRKMLSFFTCLFVQNQASAALLESIGYEENVMLSGDTRFDRVISIANGFEPVPVIGEFCANRTTIVAGSTWTDDDEELDHFANTNPSLRFIIAPHDIGKDRLIECLQLYKNAILYSDYERALQQGRSVPADINVIIIDNVGMLSRLYKYAAVCYVGGGFGEDGIHNILEAAVYGKPVVFGPVYDKYFEAEELLDRGGAFSISDALELEALLKDLLEKQTLYNAAAAAAGKYVADRAGATESVVQFIQANRLLIN
ncbi:3-deoxy-D-manno-octulosonic acid transferase [Sediminibacterium roseum]|uniref:3-deoxy-D-manno-octulosonic acid transferase n=1 Tax=Sediminibacterium roseum TaxID=1978412 RepID=A0ABX0A190_9BACT|nr:glycosyltransferase N-terminal domain-containing protein [Sediminibacterium roseum]NCI50990.1 3-deoxy-D-manno-octulosonic acid transferase [Sediminibacterium roseum]